MAEYEDILSSSDDEDILDYLNAVIRGPRQIKTRRNYLEELDNEEFKMRFRLSKECVLNILDQIRPRLLFASNRNNPASPLEQLLLTLRLYATGCHLIAAGDFSGFSTTTAWRITRRVTRAIASLRPQYVKFPVTEEDKQKECLGFYKFARFPKVIGCIDCTHVRVQSFGNADAELFRNRKGYFSMNVQVVSNYNLEITDIVARWQGSAHDATIFNNSRLCAAFEQGAYGDGLLLGDNGYPLKPYLLTPILNPRTAAEARYNKAHIRTRNTVEQLFGIWKRRFPILALGIRYNINMAMEVIVATSVLHNIARRNADDMPVNDPDLNLPAPWEDIMQYGNIPFCIQEVRQEGINERVRNNLLRYFERMNFRDNNPV